MDSYRQRPFELSSLSEAERAALRRSVDASAYGEEDWEQSLILCFAWLGQRGRKETFERICGYLSCCAEVAGREPLRPLWQSVREQLDRHGID